jgi:hypothetical protein
MLNTRGEIRFTSERLAHVRWVLCHHGMARPQVADGGERPTDMEGSCEYIE